MPNTLSTAADWIESLSNRPELPFAHLLQAHFSQARITRLCDCGCNSFDCEILEPGELGPLFSSVGEVGSFEAVFESDQHEPVDVVFYTDKQGCLSGLDVHLGLSNHTPMPGAVRLGKLLFTTPEL